MVTISGIKGRLLEAEVWTLGAQMGHTKISVSYEVKQAMSYVSTELKEVVQAKYRNLEARESKYR